MTTMNPTAVRRRFLLLTAVVLLAHQAPVAADGDSERERLAAVVRQLETLDYLLEGGADEPRHGERAVVLMPVGTDATLGPLYLCLLAAIHARLGQSAAALATLDRLFSVPGFYNEIWVQHDPRFAALRRDSAYRTHLDRWSAQKGDALDARRTPPTPQ